MAKFNPDFWEVTLTDESWRRFATEDDAYYEDPDDGVARRAREDRAL